MTDYTQLLETLAIERRAYSFGSPSDQEIGVEQLANMAVNHIPALVEEINDLRREVEALRRFGNNSCTAQADDYLENPEAYD